MNKRHLSTLYNFLGIVLTCAGILFFVYSAPTLRSVFALLLIISGTVLQSSLERFDVYGKTYSRWLEQRIQKLFAADMAPPTSLRGKKVLSTALNLFGIPLLAAGFYLVMTPIFLPSIALAGLALVIGVYLQIKFRPSFKQRESGQHPFSG